MMKKIFVILYYFLFLVNFSGAQSDLKNETCRQCISSNCIDQLHEDVYLHLSRWSIVVGERLNFKAYVLNNKANNKNTSKILYIAIIDNTNNLKVFGRANMDNNVCTGSILIPDSLITGLYKVVAYTNLMRNFPTSSFLQSSLLIIGMKASPINKNSSDGDQNSAADIFNTNNKNQENIKTVELAYTLVKQVYNRKEKVVLNLEINNPNNQAIKGSFSVSVFEKMPQNYIELNTDITSTITILGTDSSIKNKHKNYSNWLDTVKKQPIAFHFKPENRTYLLEGTLYNKHTQKIEKSKTIFLSTPDSLANLKYSVTDSAGKFIFALDRKYDNRKIFLNVNDNSDSKEYNFAIDNKQISYDSNTGEEIQIDSILYEYLQKSKKIAAINRVYYNSTGSKPSIKPFNDKMHFYGKSNYSINMADYIELEDFNEISTNLLPDLAFVKKNETYSVYIGTKIIQRYPNENCLVLLNNIPFYDYGYLAKLGSRQIEKVDMLYSYTVYGNCNFPGILSVFTKDKVIITSQNSFIVDNKVESNLHVESNINDNIPTGLHNVPDFKQLLFWEPDLVFDATGHSQIEFTTPNLPTDYIIDIEGLTNEGLPVSKRILLQVK